MTLEDRATELDAQTEALQENLNEMKVGVKVKGCFAPDHTSYDVSATYEQEAGKHDIIPNNAVPFAVMQLKQIDSDLHCDIRLRVSAGAEHGMYCLEKIAEGLYEPERWHIHLDGHTGYRALQLIGHSPKVEGCFQEFRLCIGIYSVRRNIVLDPQHKP
jgi:hypothetical protein